MADLVTPLDAYAAAHNFGGDGFIGWGYYRGASLGFDAEDGAVTVWPAGDPATEWEIDTDQAVEAFLDALDAKMNAAGVGNTQVVGGET